jgi:peptidoglycan/xylan/chitin deacetylase (PgdA/CDA1 family)
MRLADLVDDLVEGRVRSGGVVVTFDDAYLETLTTAEPILTELQIPATVFVPVGLLGKEPWWDRLLRTLWAPPTLPDQLEIREEGLTFHRSFQPGPGSDERRGIDTWRGRLFSDLYPRLLRMEAEGRARVIETICAWSGVQEGAEPIVRIMDESELTALAASPLVDIGSHSLSHPMLGLLPPEAQEAEITSSRAALRELLDREIAYFSYPNGSCGPLTQEVVKDAGYRAACASRNDLVLGSTNRYGLPRFWPVDSPDSASWALKIWLGG